MRTFTCPDGLTLVLDKITHVEHCDEQYSRHASGYAWGFTVGLVGGSEVRFPSTRSPGLHGLPGGKQGMQGPRSFGEVDYVRNALVLALTEPNSGPPTGPGLRTPDHPGLE